MPLEPAVFQKKLLAWYRKNARDLPWRRTRDPYRIWMSEIMLQQTQVATVIPYYEKWIARFPDVHALAAASREDVLRYWAGLGYYRRARMLHEAAIIIVKERKGKIPGTAEDLRKLPGIGRYTAGAIASIAFNEPVPVLDGNVIRILTRLLAFSADISLPATIKKLWNDVHRLVPDKNSGDFNQAMMELGATLCLPRNPLCLTCPVSVLCKARGKNPESFPVKTRTVMEDRNTAALLLSRNGRVLLRQQPEKERWGGLWMFPHWPDKPSMLKALGISGKELKHHMEVRHGFTKYRIRLDVFSFTGDGNAAGASRIQDRIPQTRWKSLAQLKRLPFPAPHRKIAEKLAQA